MGAVVAAVLERRRDSVAAAKKELMGIHSDLSTVQNALAVAIAQTQAVNQRVTDVWAALAAAERSNP